MSAARPEIRPIRTDEFPEYYRALSEPFGEDVYDDEREAFRPVFEPERSLAVLDEGRIVGTSGVYTREMTVPGATVPIGAVSLVGVLPTHRRRGYLTEMMRRMLDDIAERGEPLAALWASEAVIYPRFGFGLGTRFSRMTGSTREMALRPGIDVGSGCPRQVTMEEIRPIAARLYDQVRRAKAGWLDRPTHWWNLQLSDLERNRKGASALRAVVIEEPDGTPTAYAVYRLKPEWDPAPNNEVLVRDAVATTPQAYAAMWSFLLNLDLVRRVRAHCSVDEPLQHLVADARALRLDVQDNVWIRVVDVGAALAARRYAGAVDVVLDVRDDFRPRNTGRWRLTGGPDGAECARTTGEPDLALSATDLGAAYLGGVSLRTLAAAGRVHECRPGALAATSHAFVTDTQPWCPEEF